MNQAALAQMFGLDGKVAVVTGGTEGLGLAIARALAEAGAAVALVGRNAEKGAAAAAALVAEGLSAVFIQADVAQEADCRRLAAEAQAAFGRLDILINNAGLSVRLRPEDYTLAEWNQVIGVNLTGSFLCAQACYPFIRNGGGGAIVNMGSLYSTFGGEKAAPYAASKGAVVQLSKSLAVAWAADNIRVNTILPGWHNTTLTIGAKSAIEGLEASVSARTPLRRWGEPKDVAGAALFLVSPAAAFITGASLAVDGGYSAQL